MFVDLGANDGASLTHIIERGNLDIPQTEAYLFEPNPKFKTGLHALIETSELPFGAVLPAVAWDRNAVTTFFVQEKPVSTSHDVRYDAEGSSVFERNPDSWAESKRPKNMTFVPIQVCAVDFAEWLVRSFSTAQNVVVKMDIEGSEFEVLRKILDTPTALSRISKLYVEWHGFKIRPDLCGKGTHCAAEEELKAALERADVHVGAWKQ